jgi:hypothetical protein
LKAKRRGYNYCIVGNLSKKEGACPKDGNRHYKRPQKVEYRLPNLLISLIAIIDIYLLEFPYWCKAQEDRNKETR